MPAALVAIAATFALGTVAVEPARAARSPRHYTRRIERETYTSASIRASRRSVLAPRFRRREGGFRAALFSRGWQRAYIWLDPGVLAKLKALRGPGESYSDVILRVAKGDGAR
jgi:hypothetical protein